MPTNKKSTINIDLILSNYQAFRKELVESIGKASQLKEEFKDVSLGDGTLNKQLENIDKVISILTTKVSKDGKLSLSTVKELQNELSKIGTLARGLEESEGKRLSAVKFREKYNQLNGENSLLQKQLKIYNDLNTKLQEQHTILDKKSNLRSYLPQTTKGIDSLLKNSGLSDDQIAYAIFPGSTTGGFTKVQKDRRKEWKEKYGVDEEDIKILANAFSQLNEKTKQARENIEDLNKKLGESKTVIDTETEKLQKLLNQGITTSYNATDIVNDTVTTSAHLNQLAEDARKANQGMIDLSGSTGKASSTFQEATKAIISSRVVMRTLRSIMNEAIRTVREMDKALTGMTAVTGKSREEVLSYIPVLKKLAQETSSTMTDVANLTTEYLRQGRGMEDALELAKETAKAAQIAEISTAESLTYMTSAINGFNLAASDAAHVSDVFANVAAKTATDYEQLAVALSKVSAQANLAGMSLEFTTGLLAKGIETTQEAPESIGTALKTIVARMRELTDYNKVLEDGTSINKVEKALAAAGIQLRDSTGGFRDLEAVFNDLGPKWDNLNTMQQQAIAQSIAGTRQQSRFVAIMQDWDRTLEAVDMAQDSAGASAYQYSKMAEGLNATITNLTTSWQGFTTSLVDTEFIIGLLKLATNFLNTLTEASPLFKTIGVATLAIVGYTKANNLLLDYKWKKHLEILALEKQAGVEGIKNGKELQTATIKEKAKLAVLEQQLQVLKQQLLVSKQQNNEERLSLYAKIQSNENLTEEQKQAYIKRAEKKFAKQEKLLNDNFIEQEKLLNDEIGKTQNLVDELEKHSQNILTTKLKTLATDIKILFTNTDNLSETQKQHMVKNKSLLTDLKILFTSKKKAQAEGGVLKTMKEAQATQLASLGTTLAIVAAIAAVAALIYAIVQDFNSIENAQKKILENNNKIYEANQSKNSLQDLIDQYDELDRKVNKTKEDIEKMNELEASMKEVEGVTNIESARSKIRELDSEVYEAQFDNLKQTLKAYAKEGEKILDFSEFTSTLSDLTNELITSRLEYLAAYKGLTEDEILIAKEVSGKTAQGIDYNKVMKEAQQYAFDTVSTGEVWANIGRITTGITGITGFIDNIGAVVTGDSDWSIWNEDTGFGKVMSWVTNPVGNLWGLINENQNAKQAAAKSKELMEEVTTDIAQFSVDMANIMDEGFQKQYTAYEEALKSYKGVSREAIEEQYKFLKVYSGNYGVYADEIVNNFQISASDLNDLVDTYYAAGEDVAKAFIEGIYNSSKNTSGIEAAVGASLKDLYDENSPVRAQMEEKWLEDFQAELSKYESFKDLNPVEDANKLKTQAASLGWSETDPYQIVAKMKREYSALGTAQEYVNNQLLETRDQLLSLISPYEDSLSVIQAVQGIGSKNETYKKYIESALKGELGAEDIQNILSDEAFSEIKKQLLEAFSVGNMEEVASLLSSGVSYIAESSTSIYEQYLDRLKENLSVATDETSIESLKQEIQLIESIIANQGQLTEEKFNALILDKKIEALQKNIEKGITGSAKALDEFLTKEIAVNDKLIKTSIINSGFDNVDLIKKYLTSIKEGTLTWEEFSKATNTWTTTQKLAFSELYELVEENIDQNLDYQNMISEGYENELNAQIETQKEILDYYKQQLESEQEALQKSLDKRREMYEKYFDSIDQEDNTEDFESEQARLQRAIAALSSATDANSLQKMKEYQEELADLEQSRFQEERELRKEATLANLDNEETTMEQYYEDRMANEQKLWEEISRMSATEMGKMITTYSEEFKNATNLNKQYLMQSFTELIGGVSSILGISGTIDPSTWANSLSTSDYASNTLSSSPTSGNNSNNTNNTTNNSSQVFIDTIEVNIQGNANGTPTEYSNAFAQELMNVFKNVGVNVDKR